MADVKISDLTAKAAALIAADTLEINESGTSKSVTGTNVADGVFGLLTARSAAAIAVADELVFADVSDSNNDKKETLGDLLDVGITRNNTFTKSQRGSITALSDGANISTDFALNNHFSVTLAGNRTLDNPSNIVAGQSGSIFVTQDGTGSRSLAFGSQWDFVGGTAPTLSTTASAIDRIDYVVRTTSSIHAVASLAVS